MELYNFFIGHRKNMFLVHTQHTYSTSSDDNHILYFNFTSINKSKDKRKLPPPMLL